MGTAVHGGVAIIDVILLPTPIGWIFRDPTKCQVWLCAIRVGGKGSGCMTLRRMGICRGDGWCGRWCIMLPTIGALLLMTCGCVEVLMALRGLVVMMVMGSEAIVLFIAVVGVMIWGQWGLCCCGPLCGAMMWGDALIWWRSPILQGVCRDGHGVT